MEKLPSARAVCHPTATNKVINFICMNTHTLSHTVRLSFFVVICVPPPKNWQRARPHVFRSLLDLDPEGGVRCHVTCPC